MKEMECLMNSVYNKEEEKNRTIFKKSFEKEINIPCFYNKMFKNIKFINQKRFYSIDEKVFYIGKSFFDEVDKRLVDDKVALIFHMHMKNFVIYRIRNITSSFNRTIMNGKNLIFINNKFIIIASSYVDKLFYYETDLLLNGEIKLDDEFSDIFDFLVLNLQYINEKDEKNHLLKKYDIINNNCLEDISSKLYILPLFNLSFFERFSKYKYTDVVLDYEMLFKFFEMSDKVVIILNKIIINSVFFLDDYAILVYNKYIFFLIYPENIEYDFSKKDNIPFIILRLLHINYILLNEHIK